MKTFNLTAFFVFIISPKLFVIIESFYATHPVLAGILMFLVMILSAIGLVKAVNYFKNKFKKK